MNSTNLLKRLWPQAHHQYRRLPIFGQILEQFGQWSLQQGFALGTVRLDLDSLRRLVPWFQRRDKRTVDDLSATDVAEARAYYRRRNPHWAGAVRKLGRFLQTLGRLRPGRVHPPTRMELALADFEEYLRRERGLAVATIEARHYHLRQFLRFLQFDRDASLKRLTLPQIERFLARCARRYCRRSMPIVVATIRSFLRFQHQRGVLPKPLHEQVGTVRTYQHEQLPQPMPWPVVRQLLKQIDRSTPLGLRDYTVLLLAATYGLRRSEVVALTLEDIDWRARTLRISQHKAHQRLTLPLTDEAGAALADYLQHARPRSVYRQVFLRHRPPVTPMPVWMAGRTLGYAAGRAGVKLPTPHFHSLRHAVALRLLHHGAGLKSIGDLLGHRQLNTTAGYLRLDVEDLRSLALPVPHAPSGAPPNACASPPVPPVMPRPAIRRARPPLKIPVAERWRSFLRQPLQDYMARQRSLGRKCLWEERILLHLDYFLTRHYPHGRIFTSGQFAAWTAELRSLTPTGVRTHQRCVRQFCRYLALERPATFVPDPSTFPKPWPTKLPCLLAPSQVGRLLASTRCLEPSCHDPLRAQSMRLALIFMFCCGLRHSEVRHLQLADLDLKRRVLHIHESKFHKSRLVPLAASVTQALQAYLRQRARHRLPIEPTAPFLWNGRTTSTSGPLGPSAVARNWHRICHDAQVFDSQGHPPRLHDLRHSFAVEALRRGYAAGRGAQATLPRLACYMGHAGPTFTHRYLKFTEPIRQAASARLHQHLARILCLPKPRQARKGGGS